MKHKEDMIQVVMKDAKKFVPEFKDGKATQALLIEYFLETYEKLKNKGLLNDV